MGARTLGRRVQTDYCEYALARRIGGEVERGDRPVRLIDDANPPISPGAERCDLHLSDIPFLTAILPGSRAALGYCINRIWCGMLAPTNPSATFIMPDREGGTNV